MKTKWQNIIVLFFLLSLANISILKAFGDNNSIANNQLKGIEKSGNISVIDTVAQLKLLLNNLSQTWSNKYFKIHCQAILNVIDSKSTLSKKDSSLLKNLYKTFGDSRIVWKGNDTNSYLERRRPLILSWTSPSDGAVSLAWLILPENWKPEKSYPLYVRLHGLNATYADRIEYMTYYLKPDTYVLTTFNEAYVLLPWGRGNLWYEGIGGTDVFESINYLESILNVDTLRKYLVGFSMGGYGTWYLGQQSPGTWAALGMYGGALQYGGNYVYSDEVINRLKDVPMYIVCGESDGLLSYNNKAYTMLQEAGNPNLSYTTHPGGHVALLEQWQSMYEWLRNFKNDRPVGIASPSVHNNEPVKLKTSEANGHVMISYALTKEEQVRLDILNINGQTIRTLINSNQKAGANIVYWNKCDNNGCKVPSGLYIGSMVVGGKVKTIKILVE
jgi:hypothetical protein